MNTEIVVAIGALVTACASIISAVLLYRKTVALLEYRMAQVEKKLNEHNGYAQKFSRSTDAIADIKTDIAVLKNDVKYLREEK